jgi:hypothetical protein
MRLLSNIQSSLNTIFELYKSQWKSYYSFSILFVLVSSIASTILGLLILLVYQQTIGLVTGETFRSQLVDILLMNDVSLSYIISYITIMNFGLYAAFISVNQQLPKPVISFKSFRESITSSLWVDYFLFIVAGTFCIKLIAWLSNPVSYRNDGSLEDILNVTSFNSLENWAYRLIMIILDYAPYIFAFLMLRKHLKKTDMLSKNKKGWMPFWNVLILSFVISTVGYEFTTIINNTIVRLISIPFVEEYIPTILGLLLHVFLIALFYPAFAGSLLFPLVQKDERPTTLSDQLPIDEL